MTNYKIENGVMFVCINFAKITETDANAQSRTDEMLTIALAFHRAMNIEGAKYSTRNKAWTTTKKQQRRIAGRYT